MTRKEFLQSLKDVGWTFYRDEAGDHVGHIDLPDRGVQIIPARSMLSGGYRVILLPSASTDAFSRAISTIKGEARSAVPIVQMQETRELYPELTPAVVQRLAAGVLAWAQNADIEAGLLRYRELPTDAPGAFPLRHLAALAIAGDVERLQGYQDSFRRGDRLGFVPYIKEDMIDRALEIAKRKKAEI